MEFLQYETTLAVCDNTIGHIIKQLFNDLPSALDIIKCTNLICKKTTLTHSCTLYKYSNYKWGLKLPTAGYR